MTHPGESIDRLAIDWRDADRETLRAEIDRLREALDVALDAMRRGAKDHGCDYCRADIAAVERAMGKD